MRYRRRKIQYYSGVSRVSLSLMRRPWFPFAATAVAAVIIALIMGAILGATARKSSAQTYGRHELSEFGGVELPEEKYADLQDIKGEFILASDYSEFKSAAKKTDGNAIMLKVYDGAGNIYFSLTGTALAELPSRYRVVYPVDPKDVSECAASYSVQSIAHFKSGAFLERDFAVRALSKAHELIVLSELISSGIDEIVISGLPSDSELATEVNTYLKQIYDLCDTTTLGVSVSYSDVQGAGINRIIAYTQAYADSYFLDLTGLGSDDFVKAIQNSAYFLTQYKMRVMLDEANLEIAQNYGIASYITKK